MFADFLVGNGLSTKTIGIYTRLVDDAILWFAERGADLAGASAADLAAWAKSLPPSASARRQARSAIQYYLRWHGRPLEVVKAIRVPPKPRYMSQALNERDAGLLHIVAINARHPRGIAVLAGLYLALRVHEIAAMRWDRFTHDLSRYTVTGKGSYTATLPVHPVYQEQLRQACHADHYLFPGEQGRSHVHPNTVWLWVKDLGQQAGIPDLRTHQLRHTCLAAMNDATGDLRAVSEFARHHRLESTMVYTRSGEEALRRVMSSLKY